jgi:hemerythrin
MEVHVTSLTWNHACSVGIKAMDDQHGILMDAINELRQAVTRGGGREQVSELLDRLIEFTRMHFDSEERLMQQAGFPCLVEHRAQHQCLMAQILEAAHRLQYGERVDMNFLLRFVREWYLEHTATLDQQYGPWLNELGIR